TVVPDLAGGSDMCTELAVRRDDLAMDVAEHGPLGVEPADVADRFVPVGKGPGILVVEAAATDAGGALVTAGTSRAIVVARDAGAGVWLAAGPGRHLPAPLFAAVAHRNRDGEILGRGGVDR